MGAIMQELGFHPKARVSKTPAIEIAAGGPAAAQSAAADWNPQFLEELLATANRLEDADY
jgi:hypothetical protein